MKYVMFRRKRTNGMVDLFPVIFPNHLIHAHMARTMMRGALRGWEPDSAGHINFVTGAFVCQGESETLGLPSQPQRDTNIIRMNDYGAGLDDAPA